MASIMTIATAVLLLVYASLATLGSARPGDSLFNDGSVVSASAQQAHDSGRTEESANALQHVPAADSDSLDRERGVSLTSIPDAIAEEDSNSVPTALTQYFQVVRSLLGETSSGSTKVSTTEKSKKKKPKGNPKRKGCKCDGKDDHNGESPCPVQCPSPRAPSPPLNSTAPPPNSTYEESSSSAQAPSPSALAPSPTSSKGSEGDDDDDEV